MENTLHEIMSNKGTEELIKILYIEKDDYKQEAIEIARKELAKREIEQSYIQQITESFFIEQKKSEHIKSNVANSFLRFLNFIIDSIAIFIIAILLGLSFDLVYNTNDEFILFIVTITVFSTSFLFYYIFCEYKFQQTVGKALTKTKVIHQNYEKPKLSDVFIRTILRLIPFDHLSFLFVKNGLHDRLSNTYVIKKTLNS